MIMRLEPRRCPLCFRWFTKGYWWGGFWFYLPFFNYRVSERVICPSCYRGRGALLNRWLGRIEKFLRRLHFGRPQKARQEYSYRSSILNEEAWNRIFPSQSPWRH